MGLKSRTEEDIMEIQSEEGDLKNVVTAHNLKIVYRAWLLKVLSRA